MLHTINNFIINPIREPNRRKRTRVIYDTILVQDFNFLIKESTRTLITGVWATIRDNIIWCVGNGEEIDFWFDSWLDDCGLLIGHVIAAGAISLQRITVAEMVNDQGEWDWPRFEGLLPIEILLRISAKKPPAHGAKVDLIVSEDRRSISEMSKSLASATQQAMRLVNAPLAVAAGRRRDLAQWTQP
ncbi:hypothetical protein V6N13_059329 [Hibiscus sabdariffa]